MLNSYHLPLFEGTPPILGGESWRSILSPIFRKGTMPSNPFVLNLVCYRKKVFVFVGVIVNNLIFFLQSYNTKTPKSIPFPRVNRIIFQAFYCVFRSLSLSLSYKEKNSRHRGGVFMSPRWRDGATAVEERCHRGDGNLC